MRWLKHILTLVGPKEQLQTFKTRAIGPVKCLDEQQFRAYPLAFLDEDKRAIELFGHRIADYPEVLQPAIRNGGYSLAGYKWQMQKWGCPYGLINTVTASFAPHDYAWRLEYHFDTLGYPPLELLFEMSRTFAEVIFILNWQDKAGNMFAMAVVAGNLVGEHVSTNTTASVVPGEGSLSRPEAAVPTNCSALEEARQ